MCIYGYDSVDEAVAIANSLPFSFQASVFAKAWGKWLFFFLVNSERWLFWLNLLYRDCVRHWASIECVRGHDQREHNVPRWLVQNVVWFDEIFFSLAGRVWVFWFIWCGKITTGCLSLEECSRDWALAASTTRWRTWHKKKWCYSAWALPNRRDFSQARKSSSFSWTLQVYDFLKK